MSAQDESSSKKAVHVKWAGKTIALGTFPSAEADEKCARAKALTRAWRSTMRPKPTREWVMNELERLGVRIVSGKLGRKADEEESEPRNGVSNGSLSGGGGGNAMEIMAAQQRQESNGGMSPAIAGGGTLGGMPPPSSGQQVNQHYEMLKLHHMNLLQELHETTMMMNMYQQQQLQQEQMRLHQSQGDQLAAMMAQRRGSLGSIDAFGSRRGSLGDMGFGHTGMTGMGSLKRSTDDSDGGNGKRQRRGSDDS